MPVYRAKHEDVIDVVAAREADGETVVSIATDDGGVYIATSKAKPSRKPGSTETR